MSDWISGCHSLTWLNVWLSQPNVTERLTGRVWSDQMCDSGSPTCLTQPDMMECLALTVWRQWMLTLTIWHEWVFLALAVWFWWTARLLLSTQGFALLAGPVDLITDLHRTVHGCALFILFLHFPCAEKFSSTWFSVFVQAWKRWREREGERERENIWIVCVCALSGGGGGEGVREGGGRGRDPHTSTEVKTKEFLSIVSVISQGNRSRIYVTTAVTKCHWC